MRNLKKLAMVLCFLLVSSSAFALGLGGYAQFEGGSGSVDPDEGSSMDFTTSAWGIGFTLDTDPMTSGLWSYRLNLGYQGMTLDFDDFSEKFDGHAWVADNTFAFTISSDKMMRIWAGPVIRLGSIGDDEDVIDISLGEFGIGAAIGLNYQAAEKFIISPSLSVVYSGLSGDAEDDQGETDLEGSTFTYGLKVDFLYDL